MNEISEIENERIEENKKNDSSYNRFNLISEEEIDNLSHEDLKKYTKSSNKELISLKDLNQELKDISIHDYLTHIFNDEGIDKELNRLEKRREVMSILYIDLGNFKKINDTFGHNTGDDILKIFSQNILQDSIKRSGDTSGRLHGDEFMVILPNTGIKGALKVKDRIQRTLKKVKSENKENKALNILISDIGIASWNPDLEESMEKFVRRADASMYREKNKRKDIYKNG